MSKQGIQNPPKVQEKVNTTLQKEVNKHVVKVLTEYGKAEKAFINVACEIAWLYHDNRYKAVAVNCNFEEFCKEKFGFEKSQSYGLKSLVTRFGKCDENGVYTIEDKYKSYGQTQLMAMIPLQDAQIEDNIRPDMSVLKIKGIVKDLLKVEPVGIAKTETNAPTANAGDNSENDDNIIDVEASERNCIELATYSSFKEFESDLEHILQAVSDRFKSGNAKYVNIGIEW
ncbi:MAG: hypothetical protein E7290_13460 [Lachnospiraceae bacterium]|nr:hypothetical protein [Lachnospiraceae bacterium]